MDYPRWLYSRDHGSIVVDTPEDAVNLPNVEWFTTPDFQGDPLVMGARVETVPAQEFVDIVEAAAVMASAMIPPLDKRTKAYRDSLK